MQRSAPVLNMINPIFGSKHTNAENQILRESQFTNIDSRRQNKIPGFENWSKNLMIQFFVEIFIKFQFF